MDGEKKVVYAIIAACIIGIFIIGLLVDSYPYEGGLFRALF